MTVVTDFGTTSIITCSSTGLEVELKIWVDFAYDSEVSGDNLTRDAHVPNTPIRDTGPMMCHAQNNLNPPPMNHRVSGGNGLGYT